MDFLRGMSRAVAFGVASLVLAGAMWAQSSPSKSPPKKPSPKPPTPQQVLAAATARLNQTHQQARATWTALKDARNRLAQAQRDHADVLDELRKEDAFDAPVRDAAAALAEARDKLEFERAKVMRPLQQKFAYRDRRQEWVETSLRLDDLTKARQTAQQRRLPFEQEKEWEIRDLSMKVLKLTDTVAAMEDAALDEDAGYQAASEAVDEATEAMVRAMQDSKALAETNPRRQAAFKALQDAYAAASSAGKAYADARLQRVAAAKAVVAAQQALSGTK